MDKNKPFISRLSPAGQELLGIIIGIPSDFILQQFGFVALIKLHLIKLEYAFEGTYSNEGLQRGEIWAAFLVLGLFFFRLTRSPRLLHFAWGALVAHYSGRSLFSL